MPHRCANLSEYTPPKKYACQYGSSSTRWDFKGPVQHEAGGQRGSTWRPDCRTIVVQYDSTRAVDSGQPACVLQNGLRACLALTPNIQLHGQSPLLRISLELTNFSLELEKPLFNSNHRQVGMKVGTQVHTYLTMYALRPRRTGGQTGPLTTTQVTMYL